MKIQSFISAAALMVAALLSAPVHASSVSLGPNVLHSNASLNKNLDIGEYDFSSQHSRRGSSFKDRWKFTVASSSTASISVSGLQTSSTNKSSSVRPTLLHQSQRFSRQSINTSKVFDSKSLTISVFDSKGKLIASAGESNALNDLDLIAGKWYTVQVSGKAKGSFVGTYHGALNINTTLVPTVAIAPTVVPVPLGDTAPMMGSALALLTLRLRKRTTGV